MTARACHARGTHCGNQHISKIDGAAVPGRFTYIDVHTPLRPPHPHNLVAAPHSTSSPRPKSQPLLHTRTQPAREIKKNKKKRPDQTRPPANKRTINKKKNKKNTKPLLVPKPPQTNQLTHVHVGITSPFFRSRFTSIRPHLSSHSFPGVLYTTFHGSSNAENLRPRQSAMFTLPCAQKKKEHTSNTRSPAYSVHTQSRP